MLNRRWHSLNARWNVLNEAILDRKACIRENGGTQAELNADGLLLKLERRQTSIQNEMWKEQRMWHRCKVN